MSAEFEVSFNSPQCGWMSIGLKGESGEFRTTTAYAPHTNALGDLMEALAAVPGESAKDFSRTLRWNRDPEEYDFVVSRKGPVATVEVFEYPTGERDPDQKKLVFTHSGDPKATVREFYNTFSQLYEERGVDDFKENWHQEFPLGSFEKLRRSISA